MNLTRREGYRGAVIFRWVISVIALTGAVLGAPAFAQNAEENFSIPALPLSQALLVYGQQAGVSIGVSGDLTANRLSVAIAGTFTQAVALNRLLAGSGLDSEFIDPNTVRIFRHLTPPTARITPLPVRPPVAPTPAPGLEEVVVTAQKRLENAQSVPIAIEAFNEHMLELLQIGDATALSNFVSGLNVTRANVASVPFLRGVGNATGTPGNEAAVATYVDGVYLPAPYASTFSYNNIDRIEVLKGPQGTLFGRNAAGGVINIITKDPLPAPHIDFSLGSASYNTVTANFYGTSALADHLVADLAVYYENQAGGWGTNLLNGNPTYLTREWLARSKWIFSPSDDWNFTFIADYDRARNDVASDLSIFPGTTNIAGYRHVGGFYDTDNNAHQEGEDKQYGLSFHIVHDFGWGAGTSITSWRRTSGIADGDSDASPVSLTAYQFDPKEITSSQEFQLASPVASLLKWVGGVFLYADRAGQDPEIQIGGSNASRPGSEEILYDAQNTTSYAAYAQATAPVLPGTRFTGGVRYTVDLRDGVGTAYQTDGIIFNQIAGSGKWPKTTYRLALDHDFAPDILGYVSYNRGFKSGNFNELNPFQNPVAPETIDAYEIGLKSDLLDHTVRLNAAAFYYNFHSLQVQQQIVGGAGQTNAGAAEYKGIDLDATVVPTRDLTILGSIELENATYTSFANALFNLPCVTRALSSSCANSVNGGGYYTSFQSAVGFDIPFVEKATASVSANYRIPSDVGDFSLVASLAYHNGFYFDVQNTLAQPAYYLVDASALWTSPNGSFDLKLWGKNLLNLKHYGQIQINATVTDYSPQTPLTMGVTAGYHWN